MPAVLRMMLCHRHVDAVRSRLVTQGGRGFGRPPSAKGDAAAGMQNGLTPLGFTPTGGASLGRPYGRKHLAGKLAGGTAADLQAMIQMLNLRAAEIAMEMQTLQDLDKDGLGRFLSASCGQDRCEWYRTCHVSEQPVKLGQS